MTNDQFTEWLESQIAKHQVKANSDPMMYAFAVSYVNAYEDALAQYRQLAPTWIPVTPETMPDVTQLLEAAREAKDVLEEIAYNGDLKPLQEDKLRNLSSALKPFEK